MNIDELFIQVNSKLTYDDFIPLLKIKNNEEKKMIEEKYGAKLPSYSQVEEVAKFLEVEINSLFFIPTGTMNFCYFKMPVIIDLLDFNIATLEMFDAKKRIQISHKVIEKKLSENKYESIFHLIDDRINLLAFEYYFSQIPDEQKYDIFIHIYISSEYGFGDFPKQLVRQTFEYRNKEKIKDKLIRYLKKHNYLLENNYVRIYRGEGDKSTLTNQAYSWSLDINLAAMFASMWSLKGKIKTAKVHIDNIIDFIDDRSEKEIVVLPENVEEITTMDMVEPETFFEEITETNYFFDLQNVSNYIDESLFNNPDGIHGILHTKRVLLNAISIVYLIEDDHYVDEEDLDLLLKAIVYHDIGRTHDGHEPGHGEKSYQKLINLDLLPFEKGSEKDELFKFLIEQHDVIDDVAYKNIENYNVNHKQAKFLLNILKDADALDRVRIKDVDLNFLRFEQSKRLLLVAHGFFRGVK